MHCRGRLLSQRLFNGAFTFVHPLNSSVARLRRGTAMSTVAAAPAPAAAAGPQPPSAAAAAAPTEPSFTSPVTVVTPDPSEYDAQLQRKVAKIRDLFAAFAIPPIEIHASQPLHYRCRAEFTVWHEGDDLYYVMFEKVSGAKKPQRLRVDEFTVGR